MHACDDTFLCCLQGDHLYIQMELCGDSLAAHNKLQDAQPWREPELVGLLKQVGQNLMSRTCSPVQHSCACLWHDQ
jgi:hypothetical protein